MRREEIAALGELAGDAAAGMTSRVRETHQAIARRTFRAIGPGSRPVEVVHDGIAGAVYGAVGGLSRLGIMAGARAIGAARKPDVPSLGEGPSGRRALAALNGAFGDVLYERRSPLEVKLTLRAEGREVLPSVTGLRAAYPHATPRLVVFVHGLAQTEYAWLRGVSYGARLRSQLGYTPLYVRYNTGRPVDANGRDLARLLGQIEASWPVRIDDITLIGHAIGALASRSACEHAYAEPWVEKVRHLVALGAPHRGIALERLARLAGNALGRLPETRAASRALELRSAGIKDAGRGTAGGFLPHARYLFVSASVARNPGGLLARSLGDLVVSRDSAWAHSGRGEPVRFPVESYREIGPINHFDLPAHPVVLEQIVDWLSGPAQLPAGDPASAGEPQRP